jgi:uncharacterized protein YceH (UPF0502 family)
VSVCPSGYGKIGGVLPARSLDAVEIRILGSLLEKQLTTPEYYPLTLNALVAACNQKSNREPVMELSDGEVESALQRLQDEKLVWRVLGGRAVRFDHNLPSMWHIDPADRALLTLLFLRGPQSPGELRSRSDRLYSVEGLEDVEAHLKKRSSGEESLTEEMPRRPGQKESRWRQTHGGPAPPESEERMANPSVDSGDGGREPLSVRVRRLEEQVDVLTRELKELKQTLGA